MFEDIHEINTCELGLEVLYYGDKGSILNALGVFEIYKAFKNGDIFQQLLNVKVIFKSHFLFNIILDLTLAKSSD